MPETPSLDDERPRRVPGWLVLGAVVVLVGGVVLALVLAWLVLPDDPEPRAAPTRTPTPTASASASDTPSTSGSSALTARRAEAVGALLAARSQAVLAGDQAALVDQVDPTQAEFAEQQRLVARRLGDVPLAQWSYQVVGDGPELSDERTAVLPDGAAVVRVRLTYRVQGTTTETDREQYLTVVPRGGRWLLAGDTDGEADGLRTERDLWDLGPVRVRQGESAVVVADRRTVDRDEMGRLSTEADRAVSDVDRVWRADWSRQPLVLVPHSQRDMATLLGDDGKGLAQIAAVTTGSVAEGLTRGDRVVINPETFATLGPVGRRIVLSHEMTHLAARASSVQTVPIWLSEGFADFVAYDATTVPAGVVAADLLEQVRAGDAPRQLPDDAAFDAGEGDIAAAYEGAWLACRMIAQRWGEAALVRFYTDMTDSAGPGWPDEVESSLGVSERRLVRQWRTYVAQLAAST